MMEINTSMLIKLNPEQTLRLLLWAEKHATAEIEADCEPSGYSLTIEISGPYGCGAAAHKGSSELDLGDIEVTLVEESQ